MPILDPSLVFTLLNSYEKKALMMSDYFIPYFLKIASKNLNSNPETIEASLQFRKDLEKSEKYFSHSSLFNEFDLNKELSNPNVTNYFQLIYKKLKKHPASLKGYYSICDRYDLYLCQPFVEKIRVHSWFLSTKPIAILIIDADQYDKEVFPGFLCQVNLEVDMAIASGLSIILCINFNDNLIQNEFNDIVYFLTNHPFSEIHISTYQTKSGELETKIFNNFNEFFYQPYVYIYTSFDQPQIEPQQKSCFYPNIQYIRLSTHPKNAFKQIQLFNIDTFPTYVDEKNDETIPVLLSNVAIYKTKSLNKHSIPMRVSKISLSSVRKNDLFYKKNHRVKIYLEDSSMFGYVNFEDLHLIRPDLYVEKTLYLTDIAEKTLETIDNLFNDIQANYKEAENYDSIYLINIIKKRKMLECIKKAVYSYVYTFKKIIPDFFIHKTQLYVIMETCNDLIFNKKQNGLIFQIDTGEGKSCVIQIIAAVLSLMNENVHIVSSNIKLSNRDYEESLNFFRIIGKETSVLLHKNERDFVGCYKNQKNEIKNKFPEKFFDDYCFENSLNMNINVCDKNKGAKIVFSTLANFQYYYLWLMSKYPGSANSYFNESFLLMDEADSTLIDELANGAILSHSIKTNAEEVLTFIYKNRNQSPNLVLEKIKEDFPNCKNMTIEDINNIYDEIDTVNSDEFSKGYKYRLEELEFEENDDLHNLYDKYRYDSISDEIKNNIKEMVLNFLTNNIKNKNKPIKFTHVVPFDSANKGISEPNKEFTGFIQQLIAIKEKIKDPKKNANLITANLAMNYMYVSQPFFINLYHNGVCGFTGTIGDEYDIKLYNDSYSLKAKKIPRENENYRVDLPKIICEKEEKKVKIYEEIKLYHKRNYPF